MSDAAKKALHELVDRLPAGKVPKIRRVLEEEVRENGAAEAEDTRSALEKAEALGVVGCVGGGPDDPIDLATNPSHMAGFGE